MPCFLLFGLFVFIGMISLGCLADKCQRIEGLFCLFFSLILLSWFIASYNQDNVVAKTSSYPLQTIKEVDKTYQIFNVDGKIHNLTAIKEAVYPEESQVQVNEFKSMYLWVWWPMNPTYEVVPKTVREF